MNQDEKACPRCAETVKAAAKVCRFCGYNFPRHYSDAEIQALHQQRVRRNKVVFIIIAGLAALAALGHYLGPPPAQPVEGVPRLTPPDNPAHALLIAMPQAEREQQLARFMRAGGERCRRVTRSFFQGMSPAREAFWNVRCAPGRDWSIMIEPDARGSTRIMECGVVRMFTESRCWRAFES